tara:strand:- start:6156 stop:6587 length:432 start_codon:yes stop_codon:yes gene_type:complete
MKTKIYYNGLHITLIEDSALKVGDKIESDSNIIELIEQAVISHHKKQEKPIYVQYVNNEGKTVKDVVTEEMALSLNNIPTKGDTMYIIEVAKNLQGETIKCTLSDSKPVQDKKKDIDYRRSGGGYNNSDDGFLDGFLLAGLVL